MVPWILADTEASLLMLALLRAQGFSLKLATPMTKSRMAEASSFQSLEAGQDL